MVAITRRVLRAAVLLAAAAELAGVLSGWMRQDWRPFWLATPWYVMLLVSDVILDYYLTNRSRRSDRGQR